MGCDGGTIPKRDELVRKKKKAEQDNSLTLLRLYQNYPVLWNTKDENYLNFFKKDDAWDEIASRMKLSKDECRRRIINLKGSFRREKERMKNSNMNETGTGKAYQSKWFAFNAMTFLDEEWEPEKTEFEKMELEKTEPSDTFVNQNIVETEKIIIDGSKSDGSACMSKSDIKTPKVSPIRKRKAEDKLDEAFENLINQVDQAKRALEKSMVQILDMFD